MIDKSVDHTSEVERLARFEARQEDVLRRLTIVEARPFDAVPGAVQAVREVAEDMLRDRLSLTEGQIKELKTMQTRIMWLIFIGLAGQVMKMIGPSAIADMLGKIG